MRVPREMTMGLGVRMWKLRKGGVSCSRCSAAAKNGKAFARGWGSQSSEWKVKSFMASMRVKVGAGEDPARHDDRAGPKQFAMAWFRRDTQSNRNRRGRI